MVKEVLTALRAIVALTAPVLVTMSASSAQPDMPETAHEPSAVANAVAKVAHLSANPPPKPKEPEAKMPLPVMDVLNRGVLIVISKGSQQMHVYKDGKFWDSSAVSTGKKGKETPSGMFPILQKRVHHRSNLYNNAPMPHMQRLTWDGIAIHGGYVPGYPASHGCIRLPKGFARSLYKLTQHDRTTVVVTDQATGSNVNAMKLALNMPMPKPGKWGALEQFPEPQLALKEPELSEEDKALVARASTGGPSIQLVAAGSPAEAEAYWSRTVARHPELAKFDRSIIPANVGAQKVYRLRISGKNVKSACATLKQAGTDCFFVGA